MKDYSKAGMKELAYRTLEYYSKDIKSINKKLIAEKKRLCAKLEKRSITGSRKTDVAVAYRALLQYHNLIEEAEYLDSWISTPYAEIFKSVCGIEK